MSEKSLPSFLIELLGNLDSIEIVPVEVPEMEEGYHVIGTLPEDLQRLCCLWRKMNADCKAHRQAADEEIESIDSIKARAAAVERLNASLLFEQIKRDTVEKIFWTSVRAQFPELAGKKSIGLGPDFQVYWEEGEDDEDDCDCLACQIKRGEVQIAGAEIVGPIVGMAGLASLLTGLRQAMGKDKATSEEAPPQEGAASEEDAAAVEGNQE